MSNMNSFSLLTGSSSEDTSRIVEALRATGLTTPAVETPAQSADDRDNAGSHQMDLDPRVERKVFQLMKGGSWVLPQQLREEIMRMDIEQYTDTLEVPGGPDVPTAGIFDLRGEDTNNKKLPPGLAGGKKLRTILLPVTNEVDFVGQHLDLSIAEIEAAELNQDVQSPSPPRDECVKIQFHLDTQCPHIEISTFNPTTGGVMATRIHADEFRWSFENPPAADERVGFYVGELGDANITNGGAAGDTLRRIARSTTHTVIGVSVILKDPENRTWEGISEQELKEIRDVPTTSVRDTLVVNLDVESELLFHFCVRRTKGLVKLWTETFKSYFNRLLAISKNYKDFWFYRRQVEIALGSSDENAMVDTKGNIEHAIERPGMPNVNFIVPRFLVKAWSVTVTTSPGGQISYSDIKPHTWAPLNFPPKYPCPNMAAFLLKLAVEEERTCQEQRLNELVGTGAGNFFKGRFVHLNAGVYLVHVYLGRDRMVDANIKLPGPGVRIKVRVDREGNDPPHPETMVSLEGHVVDTDEDLEDTFVCVCELNGWRLALDNNSDYPTLIEYIVDDLPFKRQMSGISELQAHTYDGQGPDLQALIFNSRAARGEVQSSLANKPVSDETRDTFVSGLTRGFPFNPDESQLKACMDTIKSESGMTTIVGPPGCGKTEVAMRIGSGKLALGQRVMFVAPMNGGVHTLVDKFREHNGRLEHGLQDDEWVLFTGAHWKIAKAEKLRRNQLHGEEQYARLRDQYADYLRDADQRQNNPRYDQTMGFKLYRKMHRWAADSSLDFGDDDHPNLYRESREYLDHEANFSLYPKEQRQAVRRAMANIEERLAYVFLRQVRVVFCTLSNTAHEMILESGHWDEIILDEAAREIRSGIAAFLASMIGRFDHITWSGDHMQGGGVVSGMAANTGYNILVRNVFAELADVMKNHTSDKAPPKGAFVLQRCYRMSQNLIKWSSETCYGGLVKSSDTAGSWNRPLRNTLIAFWKERLPTNFRGTYEQIVFDVTGYGIRSEQYPGSTSRFNDREAEEIASWMIELLEFTPPADEKGVAFLPRVYGSDIAASSNFRDQIALIKKKLNKLAQNKSEYIQSQVRDILGMVETIGTIQGKERPIMFYCTVVATGSTRLQANDDLPIGFVANVPNFNVAMTRQRIARYTFGAFQLFAQAVRDKRPVTHKYGEFFNYVREAEHSGLVLTLDEVDFWRTHKEQPGADMGFAKVLQAAVTYNEQPLPKAKHQNTSGMHSIDARTKTTGKGKAATQAPANMKYGGKRDGSGNLLAESSGVKKKRGNRGSGKRHPNTKRNEDGDGGAGAANAPMAG